MNSSKSPFFLRYFVHVVGDIHQPLHACARVNESYKKESAGNRGGNSVKVNIIGEIKKGKKEKLKNMHKVFDYVFGELNGD